MNKFTSFLTPHIQAYVFYQKASGHWNEVSYEPNLVLFERYCKNQYPEAAFLSQEMVDGWCHKRNTETNNSCRSRIYVVVSFIRYLRKRGKADVTEPDIPRKEKSTYIPHFFTDAELENFFRACDNLPSLSHTPEQRSRKITIPVFFRLLYSSGIRTNEARMLKIEDVDLCCGIINIRYSKGHAQHYVVLHDSMFELLKTYDSEIQKQHPLRVYFFPARGKSFHTRKWVQTNFRELWNKYNSSHATAYEFRHHYAIENINHWTDKGFGFDAKLLYLSKSMGHSTLESTKYYYSLVPGMDEILSLKTEQLNLDAEKANVTIIGKGSKIRTLYLLPKAVSHLKKYLKEFHGDTPNPKAYVFYSRNTGLHGKMSQAAVNKQLKKHARIAHEICDAVPQDLHAHQLRHAKASHWLEDGMNIVQISFLLGHEQLQTIMVYLDITIEQEVNALATLEDENDKKVSKKWKKG